ncbi:hypothetical protein BK133_11760 [Paenibacillus sp. FSL H8-0548]|nr:hypothetical protein BK133_11760 [Paenibacillus sp. FSL H8-0548]
MLKKFFGSVLCITMLISMMGSITWAKGGEEASRVDSIAAQQAAAAIILDELVLNKETTWSKDTKLKEPVKVYDPSGKHVAYLVDIIDNEKTAEGFVMVSAFLDDEPIMLWATDGQSINSEEATNIKDFQEIRTATKEVVWFGGLKFGIKINKADGSEIIIDESQHIYDSVKSESYPIPQKEDPINRQKWAHIMSIPLGSPGQSNPSDGVTNIDPSTWESGYNSIDKYYIDGVANQKQWHYTTTGGVNQSTGCSPTAGSNIVKWYANTYPSLNPTNNQANIVMALRTTMGTTQTSSGTGITDHYNIDDGLQTYFRNNGRPNAEVQNGLFPDYSAWKIRVSTGNPTLQSYWSQNYFGDHTVTVVGYKEFVRSWYESNSKYLVVKNNWQSDTSTNFYVKYGSWNTNVVTWVKTP